MNRFDAFLLDLLVTGGCSTEFKAIKVSEINSSATPRTVYLSLVKLIKSGYVAHGLMDGHKKTYYATEKGLEYHKGVIAD